MSPWLTGVGLHLAGPCVFHSEPLFWLALGSLISLFFSALPSCTTWQLLGALSAVTCIYMFAWSLELLLLLIIMEIRQLNFQHFCLLAMRPSFGSFPLYSPCTYAALDFCFRKICYGISKVALIYMYTFSSIREI